MPRISRLRARLPEVQRTLQPPDPYRLMTEAIVQEGRRERQAVLRELRLREAGIEDMPDGIKLVS